MSKLLLLILLLGVLVMLYLFYDKIMLVIDDNNNNNNNNNNSNNNNNNKIQKLKFSSDKPQKQTKYDFIDEESESVEFDETTIKTDNTHNTDNSGATSDLFDSATDNKSTYTINTLELQKN